MMLRAAGSYEFRAVVLAGGFGTRIRHILPDVPKPMAPCNGRPFVEWVVRYLVREGITDVVLSTGYLAEKIALHFQSVTDLGARTLCVPEKTPLGTGGGFMNCVAATEEPYPDFWVVTNGDSLTVTSLAPLFQVMRDPRVDAAVLGLRVDDASRYGTLRTDSEGRLLEFAEKRPGAGVINAGVYVFRHSILSQFGAQRPLSFETDVFPRLVKEACVRVLPVDALFLDIGTPETLWAAEAFVSDNLSNF